MWSIQTLLVTRKIKKVIAAEWFSQKHLIAPEKTWNWINVCATWWKHQWNMCMCTFLVNYFTVHHQKHTTITAFNDKTEICCYCNPSHTLNHIKSPHLYLWLHVHTRAASVLLSAWSTALYYLLVCCLSKPDHLKLLKKWRAVIVLMISVI